MGNGHQYMEDEERKKCSKCKENSVSEKPVLKSYEESPAVEGSKKSSLDSDSKLTEYWIDGYFHEHWTGKSYFSHERGVYVPMFATVRLEDNRIYVDAYWARKILNPKRIFDSTKKNDMLDMCLSKIINVPWVKERSKSPFKVSLP